MSESETRFVSCPFCAEEDFDLIGLKHHLTSGLCEPYEAISLNSIRPPMWSSDGK